MFHSTPQTIWTNSLGFNPLWIQSSLSREWPTVLCFVLNGLLSLLPKKFTQGDPSSSRTTLVEHNIAKVIGYYFLQVLSRQIRLLLDLHTTNIFFYKKNHHFKSANIFHSDSSISLCRPRTFWAKETSIVLIVE